MASPALDIELTSPIIDTYDESFITKIEEGNSSDNLNIHHYTRSFLRSNYNVPKPPPPPPKIQRKNNRGLANSTCVPKETKDMWDRLFRQGYGANLHIIAQDGSVIAAHQSVLSVASPVLGNLLQQSEVNNGTIKIPGIPYNALYLFIRFLYSSCYEEEEMKKYILHMLVVSHFFAVPSLKIFCVSILEQGWLTKENVMDVLQLAKNCDVPRLEMICLRMVVRDFKCISATDGWKVMKHSNPYLEQEILEYVVETDSRKQDRVKKIEEKKVYLQLHEAMEALLHIYWDGCRTIGPRDKVLKGNKVFCSFPACKGLETLIRHFHGCKTRVPGGCVHCKRMWQLLELHSFMCNEPDYCKVPLCRNFKVKMQRQSKKEAAKWNLLASRVVATKNVEKLFSPRRSSF